MSIKLQALVRIRLPACVMSSRKAWLPCDIMAGNAVYVVLLRVLADKTGRNLVKQVIAWAVAAAAKFVALYLIVVKIICGVLSENLLAAGTLKAPMLKALPATFSWPQLFTALIGGAVALLIVPVIRKSMHK